MSGLVRSLTDGEAADVGTVGGKAASLMALAGAGFPVPGGAVLTTAFFEPWFAELRETTAWQALVDADPADWPTVGAAVKAAARTLLPSPAQERALRVAAGEAPGLLAVRSSSPEEDQAGASFAGAYETVLGVRADGLLDAVRTCFASSLDPRILVYKREHGFDPLDPRIAVVVQHQLDSTCAGVGFSLDPLDNDYDHAVFDAAWGLGESVVSGAVTPDHFVVDKVTGEILTRRIGEKQQALQLRPDGGHQLLEGHRASEPALTDAQLAELTALISRVEAHAGAPVDIEWAYADSALHLLQARPITTWVPLPASMVTAPGARRRLYQDLALNGGLTINAPISPIGQSWFARFGSLLIRAYIGELPVQIGPGDELWVLEGGRMYQDLSNVLWLSSPKLLAMNLESTDALVARTLREVDGRRYRSERRPSWVSLPMLLAYPRIVWRARGLIRAFLRAFLSPRRAAEGFFAAQQAFEQSWRERTFDGTGAELLAEQGVPVIHHVIEQTMPPLMASMVGVGLAQALVPKRLAHLADALARGFAGNVVVDMGVALRRMADLLDPADRADPERLAERLEARDLPAEFLDAWDDFVRLYGWRGPHEVDLGTPRYRDRPVLALRQLCAMDPDGFDPAEAHAERIAAREAAYAEVRAAVGPLRRFLLDRAWTWLDLFGGGRDTPKHHYLMLFALARQRLLVQGQALVDAGRLDHAEHVLDLTLEDLEAADADADLDLRARRADNTRFLDLLRRHVTAFPAIIDSRGRILRPSRGDAKPGELVGSPISRGVVRGPAVVLHEPDEKPVRPGDILVAHTTDPGWTPLFVNAAAVVLEVGGSLQHGAVVAREYGKPCVAGISDVLRRLKDGQIVEVDGSAGVVRIVEGAPDDR